MKLVHIADSSIDQSEKDDQQVERLIDKKPAPSRKNRPKRGPKHDQRRRRMKIDDPDMSGGDPDMSLSSLFSIAARIAAKERIPTPSKPKKESPPKSEKPKKESPIKPEKPKKDPEARIKERANSLYQQILRELNPISGKISEAFDYWFNSRALPEFADPKTALPELKKFTQSLSKAKNSTFSGRNARAILDECEMNWGDPIQRACVLAKLQNTMHKSALPASVKAPFMHGKGDTRKNLEIIEKLLQEAASGKSFDVDSDEAISFATVASIFKILKPNPDIFNAEDMTKEVDVVTERIYEQSQQMMALPAFMKSWSEAINKGNFRNTPNSTDPGTSIESAMLSIRSLYGRDPESSLFDQDTFQDTLEKVLESKYGKISPDMLQKLESDIQGQSRAATSNELRTVRAMTHKTAQYHGVLQQGHPGGEDPGYKSYDRRYFTKENYESILASAKEFMESDWLKYEWEAGADEMPFRVALDLAIQTADNCLYQSKIDTETYNMLLNRLAGLGHDLFEDTFLPQKSGSNRSASAMNNEYQKIMRVASELRKTNPRAAFEVVTNLRSLIANSPLSQNAPNEEPSASVAQSVPEEACTETPAAVAQVTDADTDGFVDGKLDMKDLKHKTQKLVDAKDMDDFVDGLKDLHEVTKKTAGRTASVNLADVIDALDEFSPEDGAEFIKTLQPDAKKLSEISHEDVEAFMEGLEKLFSDVETKMKEAKMASTRISIASLARLAKEVPAARAFIMPVLLAAKKKSDKKKEKKVSQKKKSDEKDEKKDEKISQKEEKSSKKKSPPPFGGKQAPPFSKGKKKKASVASEDADW